MLGLRRSVAAPNPPDPIFSEFHAWHYLRQNQRVQEHLASLGLPLQDRTVLEVGAGIGDHTSFFLDRGCTVRTSDGRPENVQVLRDRYPDVEVSLLDLDDPDPSVAVAADVVYVYGTLYHLREPAAAIAFLADRTRSLMLLETCVTPGDEVALNPVEEPAEVMSQALSGYGCRPTRPWVWQHLKQHFEHVYMTVTQPWHRLFPLDWNVVAQPDRLYRCVFVASRTPLNLATLTSEISTLQTRH